MFRVTTAVLLALLTSATAEANYLPYFKMAQEFGTPRLLRHETAKDKGTVRDAYMYVPNGQTSKNWTKMTTVSILRVPASATDTSVRGVILSLRRELKARNAQITAFDESTQKSTTCFFDYDVAGEEQQGIVYSPDPGFVTIAQVGIRGSGTIDPSDVGQLKYLIGK